MNEKQKLEIEFIGNDTLETLLERAEALNMKKERAMRIYESKGLFGLKKNIERSEKQRKFNENMKKIASKSI